MDATSRKSRAEKLGFTVPAYHGTGAKFDEFRMGEKSSHSGFAPFFADKKAEAKGYAEKSGGRVLNVLLRIRKPLIVPDTFGVSPKDYPEMDEKLYRLITGGKAHYETKRERYATPRDAIEHAMDVHYEETGNYDRMDIWTKIYKRLTDAGYDAIVWQGTPADHTHGIYDKIVMLDMSGIRLTSAAFDPSKSSSRNLRA